MAGRQDVRIREAALLRALGATRKQLSQAQWVEFIWSAASLAYLLRRALVRLVGAGQVCVQICVDFSPMVACGYCGRRLVRNDRWMAGFAECPQSTAFVEFAERLALMHRPKILKNIVKNGSRRKSNLYELIGGGDKLRELVDRFTI